MGTPQFAVPSLHSIACSERHNVAAVVTNTDKPQGRGRILRFSQVKAAAIELNLPILQPLKLNDTAFLNEIKNLSPDVFVVVAFKILPDILIEIPKNGALNVHASLLPKYRGPAPIQWALINGDKTTGITIMKIDSGIDTGAILMQKEIEIHSEENAGELSGRLAKIGAKLIIDALDALEENKLNLIPQDSSKSTKAPKITTDIQHIDWSMPAHNIINLIRGLSPDRAAFTFYKGKKIKIYNARSISGFGMLEESGTILSADPEKNVVVKAGDGDVELLVIQKEGKKAMAVKDFLRGNALTIGEKLL